MVPKNIPDFIPNSGGSIVTRNVLDEVAPIRWAFREESVNPADNGWRFFSAVDDEEYLADPSNSVVVSFNTVIAIEPIVMDMLHMPIGTELTIDRDADRRITITDTMTGEPVDPLDRKWFAD